MKVWNKNSLRDNLINHPYDSNPEYLAKINFLYFSDDEKVMSAYWEAPEGWFDVGCSEFDELNYLIEGEIELVLDNKVFLVKEGDCFLIHKGDRVKFRIKKFSRTIFFIYPSDKKVLNEINTMIRKSN